MPKYPDEDCYEILGVDPKASPEVITAAFKVLATPYHPDKHTNDSDADKKEAEQKFKRFSEAYSYLIDPKSRREFDDWRRQRKEPRLEISPTALDFGTLSTGEIRTRQLKIENFGGPYNGEINLSFKNGPGVFTVTCEPIGAGGFPLLVLVTADSTTCLRSKTYRDSLDISLDCATFEVPLVLRVVSAASSPSATWTGTSSVPGPGPTPVAPTAAPAPPPAPVAASPTTTTTRTRSTVGAFWANAIGCVAGFIFAETAGPMVSRVVMAIDPQPPNWLGACLLCWVLVSSIFVGVFVAAILRGNGKRAARVTAWGTGLTVVLVLLIAVSVSSDRTESSSAYVSNNPGVLLNTKLPTPPNTTIMDDFNGSAVGNASGITYVEQPGSHGKRVALFRQSSSSRIEYQKGIPAQGTLEWVVNVAGGYYYGDFRSFSHQNRALIFSTDASGGDVTWPGTAKLSVSANGDISFFLATNKYNQPPTDPLEAKGTRFRFNEWHAIAISYGSQGQAIMIDGSVVAQAPQRTQILGASGNHQEPLDVPTLGECVSHYWAHHRYEGGFEGTVAEFRASKAQYDWYVARSYGSTSVAAQANVSTEAPPPDGESGAALLPQTVESASPPGQASTIPSSPSESQLTTDAGTAGGSDSGNPSPESSPVSSDTTTSSDSLAENTARPTTQPRNEVTANADISIPHALAAEYLRSHDPGQFETAATEVLHNGGSVTVELMHEHSGLSGDSVHPVSLTLTPTTISYDPGGSSCKYGRFTASLNSIQVVEVSNKAVEGKFIGVVVRHIVPGTYLMHLEVRDPARSNEKVKLYLATADSYTVKQANNVNYLASRSNSTQILGAVTNVIRQAMASSH